MKKYSKSRKAQQIISTIHKNIVKHNSNRNKSHTKKRLQEISSKVFNKLDLKTRELTYKNCKKMCKD